MTNNLSFDTEKKTNKARLLLEAFINRLKSEPEKSFTLKLHGKKGIVTGYKIEEDSQI